MSDNRANGFLLTNHRDGVPVTIDTRRYAIFFTAQQSVDDLYRDNMGPEYFRDLLDWFTGEGAYASWGTNYGLSVSAHYLKTLALEAAYDPAQLSIRAPRTSTTDQVLIASYGKAEQEVLEAIGEAQVGFSGGYVSSRYLDILLTKIRAPVPLNKRGHMMKQIGYILHPGLPEGRAFNIVMPDNAKSKIYIRLDHDELHLTGMAAAAAYSRAQDPSVLRQSETSAALIAFGPRRA